MIEITCTKEEQELVKKALISSKFCIYPDIQCDGKCNECITTKIKWNIREGGTSEN